MTLLINNDVVAELLTMEDTIAALEDAYLKLAREEAVCRPRIDIQIPTRDPKKVYQWGTMEGGARDGYFAIRMKSDVIYEQEYNGVVTQEKYCKQPGLFCGLILLNDAETGEPLAEVHARDEEAAARAVEEVRAAYELADEPPSPRPVVLDVLG